MCVQKCTQLWNILGSCMWKTLSTWKNASNTLPMEAISSCSDTCTYASCPCAFPKIGEKNRTFEYVIFQFSFVYVSTRHDFERHLFLDVHVWYIYVPGICTCPIYIVCTYHMKDSHYSFLHCCELENGYTSGKVLLASFEVQSDFHTQLPRMNYVCKMLMVRFRRIHAD